MRNALRDLIGLAQDIAEAAIRRAKTFLRALVGRIPSL